MGFWRAAAKAMLDKKEFERAERMQAQYGYQRQPGFIASLLANRRADRWADQYWQDNETINRANTPLWQRGMDLGHPSGCTCRWCGG